MTQVDVQLPKLSLDTSVSLFDTLEAMGLSPGNFPNISTTPSSISFVRHEGVLQLDEGGVSAAGATAVGGVGSIAPSPGVAFDVDQPFLLVIRDTTTGTLLFLGQVLDPLSH